MVIALVACGNKTESTETPPESPAPRKENDAAQLAPLVAKHKAAMSARLAAMDEIIKLAAAEPPVTQLEPLPAPVTGPSEAFQIRTLEPSYGVGINTSTELDRKTLDATLRGESVPGMTAGQFEAAAKLVDTFGWLAVVRVREFDKIVVADGRFSGGNVAGDVIAYDLKTKQRVGAFPFEVHMPATTSVPTRDVEGTLHAHLHELVMMDVQQSLSKLWAGKAVSAVKAPIDNAHLRQRQIVELLAAKKMIAGEVEITEEPTCKVVLVTPMPGTLAAHKTKDAMDPGDGVIAPAVIEAVRQVMDKDCAVSVRVP